jgi:hypothetical protein
MTVNAARRPRRRTVKPTPEPVAIAPVGSYAIGEINQTVFDCPQCSRPLAVGTRRCPGCRTRLVLGVPLSKATIFAAVGLAMGIAVGSVGGVVFAATQMIPAAVPAPAPTAAPVVGPSAGTVTRPTTAPVASMPPPSPATGTDTGMPPLARSALVQAITVNEQLAGASGALRAALATAPFDASGVAEILRSISADAVYGADLADRVSGWPDSASIGTDLSGVYGAIHDSATNTLVASVRNTGAYRDGARAMVALLAKVAPVDARARDLATDQGVILPEATAQS